MSEGPGWTAPERGLGSGPAGPGAQGEAGSGWGESGGSRSGAPKPGVIPLRPLGVGELLDAAFATIRGQPRLVLGLSALVVAAQLLVALAVGVALGNPSAAVGATDLTSNALPLSSFVPSLAGAAVGAVAASLLTGAMAVIVTEVVLGRTSTARGVAARLRPLLWRLVGASLAAGLLPFLGLAALIVGGVFLWGALALTEPALVLERTTVRGALRRSWRLAVPDWWRVFGIRLLATVLAGVVAALLALPFTGVAIVALAPGAASGHTGLWGPALVSAGTAIGSVLTMPFPAAVSALLYIDRRIRAEALDLALTAAVAQATGAPTTGPTVGPPPSATW